MREFMFDRAGQPITVEEFARLLKEPGYRRVAEDDVVTDTGRLLWVSTVWLGIDFGLWEDHPPVVFETMGFEDGMGGVFTYRWSTEEEAQEGHRALVEVLRTSSADLDLEEALEAVESLPDPRQG